MLAVARADYRKKFTHHVAFEVELDLSPFVHPESPELSNEVSLVYELVAVMVHKGNTLAGGHCVSYSNINAGSGGTFLKYPDLCGNPYDATASCTMRAQKRLTECLFCV